MSVFLSLMRHIGTRITGKRRWTPSEIRELISRGRISEAAVAIGLLSKETPEREIFLDCLEGEIAFHQRRDSDAEAFFRKALVRAPGHSDAHYGLSLVMLERGEAEVALRHAQFAVNNGTEPRLSAQLGLCELVLRNYNRAAEAFMRATRLDPNDKASWNNLGIALRALGSVKRARRAFDRAIALDPDYERAVSNNRLLEEDALALGISLELPSAERDHETLDPRLSAVRSMRDAGDTAAAIDACEELCSAHSDDVLLVIELFGLYRELGDTQSGLDALEAFRSRHPDDIDCLDALGKALLQQHEYKVAKPLIERALAARPDDVSLLLAMSEIRGEQDRHVDAGALIEKALSLDRSLSVKGKLAANLVRRCKYVETLDLLDEIIAEHPSAEADLLSIKVYALTYLGRYEEALPGINAAIERNPNDPNCRWPRGCINLLNENFAEGWDDYTYRNLNSTTHLRMVPFPLWRDEPLAGKTLLVLAEQGLGDQVMFASCLPDLLELGPARTIVEVINRVAPTVARSFSGCEVIATKQDDEFAWVKDLGPVDYFVMMGDLPRRFRRSAADFPLHDGYLSADPARVAYWRERLAALGRHPKIGVSWRGGTESTRKILRTMAVEQLVPMTQCVEADWICLQYGDVKADLARADAAGLRLHYWPEAIKDLDEFAALITALDLVITVCNTTVHYAGALAAPVWVMAPRVPEWRYGLHSASMHWYPSSRVYRQRTDGEWEAVLEKIQRELVQRFAPKTIASETAAAADVTNCVRAQRA